MNINDRNLRHEDLEMLTSLQLDELLHTELEKDTPDSEIVLPILHILEERETGDPNNDVDVETAWKVYKENQQKDTLLPNNTTQKKRKPYRWLGKVAAVAAIVCILIVVAPKAMGAESIFEIIGRWTQSIFEFFNPTDSTEAPEEYVFKTDHPGLQQIYDAVVEQGVTQPTVPTWVPDGFVLDELKTMPVRDGKKVYAGLKNGENFIIIAIEIYEENRSNQYTKDDDNISVFEREGIKHYIMSNDNSWQGVWSVDNLECMILTNYSEEIVHQVITSIYEEVD